MRWVLGCLFLLVASPVGAQIEVEDARASLRGLVEVRVVIAELDPELELYGVGPTVLASDVKESLADSGIRILGDGEAGKHSPASVLYVILGAITASPVLYSLELRLGQSVLIARHLDSEPDTPRADLAHEAYTWGEGVIGLSDGSKFRKTIRDDLVEMVKLFLEDHRAANGL